MKNLYEVQIVRKTELREYRYYSASHITKVIEELHLDLTDETCVVESIKQVAPILKELN